MLWRVCPLTRIGPCHSSSMWATRQPCGKTFINVTELHQSRRHLHARDLHACCRLERQQDGDLEAAGARPDRVTKLTIFVANYKRDYLPMIEEGRVSLFGTHKPADTLVGVAALSRPDYMLEVDAVAVIDEGE